MWLLPINSHGDHAIMTNLCDVQSPLTLYQAWFIPSKRTRKPIYCMLSPKPHPKQRSIDLSAEGPHRTDKDSHHAYVSSSWNSSIIASPICEPHLWKDSSGEVGRSGNRINFPQLMSPLVKPSKNSHDYQLPPRSSPRWKRPRLSSL